MTDQFTRDAIEATRRELTKDNPRKKESNGRRKLSYRDAARKSKQFERRVYRRFSGDFSGIYCTATDGSKWLPAIRKRAG